MKKLSVAVILIAIGSVFFLRSAEKPLPQQQQQRKKKSSKKIFLGPRRTTGRTKEAPASVVPPNCRLLKDRLEEIDFNLPAEEWLAGLEERDLKACDSAKYAKRMETIQAECFRSRDAEKCGIELVFLRSLLRTEGVTDGDDKEMLADLILSQFTKDLPDFPQLERLTSKLMDLDPSGASVQKLWAMSKLLSQRDLSNLPPDLSEEIRARVDPELLDDRELLGLNLLLENGTDPEKIEGSLRERMEADPDDSYLHEILGWSLWNQNKRAEALAELERAIELNPKDQWLRDLQRNLGSGNASVHSYQGRLMLGVETDDLFN